MRRIYRNLATGLFAIAILVLMASCSKEKVTLKRIEGTWNSTSFEYSPNYKSDFESDPGSSPIDLWDDVRLTFGPVNGSGEGKVEATGNGVTRIWVSATNNIAMEYNVSEVIGSDYSISSDGKYVIYSDKSGILYQDQIVSLSKSKLILNQRLNDNGDMVKVTYER